MITKGQMLAMNRFVVEQKHRLEEVKEKLADLQVALHSLEREVDAFGRYLVMEPLENDNIQAGEV
jgi:hypothetical protein